MSVAIARLDLGVTPERVYQLIDNGELKASKDDKGHWAIEVSSLMELVAARNGPTSSNVGVRLGAIEEQLEELSSRQAELLHRLEQIGTLKDASSAALADERDRYRADASTMREAALRLNASARQIHDGFKALLDALHEQSEVISQLLAPGNPAEIIGSEPAP